MISWPYPSFKPLVKVANKDILSVLAKLPDKLSVGIGVFGPAAAYALVWELGSKRLKKPGPKTMWGTNRFGKKRIFSTQAPSGYVSIHQKQMVKILDKAINGIKFDMKDMQKSKLELEIALDNAAQKIAGLVRQSAPVDSGTLKTGIEAVYTDEAKLLNKMDQHTTLIIV